MGSEHLLHLELTHAIVKATLRGRDLCDSLGVGDDSLLIALFAEVLYRLIPIVALRLWYLSPSKNTDPNNPAITAGIYTEVALECAFMLSNITCLKPFLRPFHSGYFVSTVDNKNSGGYLTTKDSVSRGDAYYMISTARSATDNKDGPIVQGERESVSPEKQSNVERNARAPAFRPDHSSHRATVLSGDDDQIAPVEREGSEDMIISKTQAWTVSYEDDQQKKSTKI